MNFQLRVWLAVVISFGIVSLLFEGAPLENATRLRRADVAQREDALDSAAAPGARAQQSSPLPTPTHTPSHTLSPIPSPPAPHPSPTLEQQASPLPIASPPPPPPPPPPLAAQDCSSPREVSLAHFAPFEAIPGSVWDRETACDAAVTGGDVLQTPRNVSLWRTEAFTYPPFSFSKESDAALAAWLATDRRREAGLLAWPLPKHDDAADAWTRLFPPASLRPIPCRLGYVSRLDSMKFHIPGFVFAAVDRTRVVATPPPASYFDGDETWPPAEGADTHFAELAGQGIPLGKLLTLFVQLRDLDDRIVENERYPFSAKLTSSKDATLSQGVSFQYRGRGVFELRVIPMLKNAQLVVQLDFPFLCHLFGREDVPESWTDRDVASNKALRDERMHPSDSRRVIGPFVKPLPMRPGNVPELEDAANPWPPCIDEIAAWGYLDLAKKRYRPFGCRLDGGYKTDAGKDEITAWRKCLDARGGRGRLLLAGDSTTRQLAETVPGAGSARASAKTVPLGHRIACCKPFRDKGNSHVTHTHSGVSLESLVFDAEGVGRDMRVLYGEVPSFPKMTSPTPVEALGAARGLLSVKDDVLHFKPCPMQMLLHDPVDDMDVIRLAMQGIRRAMDTHSFTVLVTACEFAHTSKNLKRLIIGLKMTPQRIDNLTFWFRHFAGVYGVPFFDGSLVTAASQSKDLVHYSPNSLILREQRRLILRMLQRARQCA